jgi:hypothetical protein
MGPATDLAPEDLMAGAAEIQGALCWHQTEGRCWRWGQIRVRHVKTPENIETEEELAQLTHRRLATSPRTRTSTSTACCMFLFSSAQIESFFGFDDLSFSMVLPCSKADYLSCITKHTQLARPSSFRETHTGALNCEIPKWTSKKVELATKVFISFHTILDSAYSHTFFLFTRS